MGVAVAEELDEKEVKKIAKKVQRLLDKLEVEDNPKKIKNMEKRLDRLLVELNVVGLYTEEQFETIKAERLGDRPPEKFAVASSVTCSTCEDDSKSIHFRVGFDYKLWGFYGTASGFWDEISDSDRNGSSQAYTDSWSADYMHTWVQYYCESCSSADVAFSPYINTKDGKLVKDYGTTSKTIISSTIVEYYPSSQAYANVKGNDNANLVANLSTIR